MSECPICHTFNHVHFRGCTFSTRSHGARIPFDCAVSPQSNVVKTILYGVRVTRTTAAERAERAERTKKTGRLRKRTLPTVRKQNELDLEKLSKQQISELLKTLRG